MSAGQNSECETSGEGGNVGGQNSGYETSGEGGTSARQNSFPGGMSYAAHRRGGPSACAREREPRCIFLGRTPQVGEGLERETGLVVWLNGCTHGYGRTWL